MDLHMIIKLFARELPLADLVLIFVRRNAVFGDRIAVTVINRLRNVRCVGRFVTMAWKSRFRGIMGGRIWRRGWLWRRRGGIVGVGSIVDSCSAGGGDRGKPRRI